MIWNWLTVYGPQLLAGFGITLLVWLVSVVAGFCLAVPLAVAQIKGGWVSRNLSRGFCATFRGTPLLLQLFFLYYGVGSLFAVSPALRVAAPWLVRLDAIWYVLLAFTLNFMAHEAEVLRGGLMAVPRGELESAHSFGFSNFQVLRRVWLPSAVLRILPVLASDVIAQLKSTPIAFTVPVVDLMAVAQKVMQDRLLIYEPLLFVAAVYVVTSFAVLRLWAIVERRVPSNWQA